MKKIKIFILLFVIFSVGKVKAECDRNLNISLANNIAYSYKYNGTSFDLTFTNLNNMFYIMDQDDNYYGGFGEATVYGLTFNKVYTFRIYSTILDCDISAIRTINIKTPPYNYYYDSELCNYAKDFEYCKRWSVNNLSFDDMFAKVSEYTQSEEPLEVNEAVYKKTLFTKIKDLYTKYYYLVLPLVIILSIYVIYRVDKKDSLF